MRIAAIHFQLPINMPTQPIVRNHSANGAFDQQFRVASAPRPNALRFMSADVTGKTHITFLFFLLSGEPDFFRVDHNNKVSGVDMWCENGFSFPAQQVGSLHRDAAKHLVLASMTHHLRGTSVALAEKRFHLRKRARKVWVDKGMSTQAMN